MGQVVDLHSRLGSVLIGGIRIDTLSRDDITALLMGPQLIRCDEGTEPFRGGVHGAPLEVPSTGHGRLHRVLRLAGGCARPPGGSGHTSGRISPPVPCLRPMVSAHMSHWTRFAMTWEFRSQEASR